MTEFTEAQKDHIDERIKKYMAACATDVKKEFYDRLKLPLIGLAGLFAVAVSIFATYLYMQARINVMQAQTEFATVKKEFYEDAMAARKEIDEMMNTYKDKLEDWNRIAENAEKSAQKMAAYEQTLEQIATNFKDMSDGSSPTKKKITNKEEIPPMPELIKPVPQSKEMFQIPQQQTLR